MTGPASACCWPLILKFFVGVDQEEGSLTHDMLGRASSTITGLARRRIAPPIRGKSLAHNEEVDDERGTAERESDGR